MSFFKHAQQRSGPGGDAPQDRAEDLRGPAPSSGVTGTSTSEHAARRHTGYAPTDLGMAGDAAVAGQHTGYAPTDSGGPRADRSPTGGPGGMAGGGLFHSQGGGHLEDGLHHSGWGPTDARFNDLRPASVIVDHRDDDPPPADAQEPVRR